MSLLATARAAASIAAVFALVSTRSLETIAAPHGAAPSHDPAAVINSVLSAWDRADAHAIAAQYEPDGDFVGPTGDHAVGHGAIEAFYKAAFEAGYAGSTATAAATHVRALSTTFALIDGHWAIQPTVGSKIREPESGLFVAVLHWHDGHWWISALREQTSAKELRELNARSGVN
jgi:uncharacterized protein (TIGR02246 family)